MDAPETRPATRARHVHVHVPLPHLYDGELARFAPTARERRIVSWLMRLLRLPGVTRAIRAWHAWRTR
jgi:hypothetical protein